MQIWMEIRIIWRWTKYTKENWREASMVYSMWPIQNIIEQKTKKKKE